MMKFSNISRESFSSAIRGHGVGQRLHYPIWTKLLGNSVGFIERRDIPNRRYTVIIVASPPFAQIEDVYRLSDCADLIICEKPCGLNSSIVANLLKSNISSKIIVNYQLRFHPLIDSIYSLINCSICSRINILYQSSARLNLANKPAWYASHYLGGGVHFSLLSHFLDLLVYLGARNIQIEVIKNPITNEKTIDFKKLNHIIVEGQMHLDKRISNFTIQIDTCSFSNTFICTIFTERGRQKFDFLNNNYDREPLLSSLSTASSSPWKKAYENLVVHLILSLSNSLFLEDKRYANVRSALNVHELIEQYG